jgi:hypothetical protein
MITILIRRVKDIKDIVLEKGETVYCFSTNSFYVGDGETSMINLKQHNGIVKGDDGKVYIVNVDKNGEPHCTPYVMKDRFSKKLYELKCE